MFDEYDVQVLEAATKRCCELSLIDFMEEMWPEVESKPFVRNWHHELICEHLEAMTRGEIQNLLINVPPGCTKSLLVCVMWPCWAWATNPKLRWFFVSYHQHYSTRDSTKCRKLIDSPHYRRYWGDVVRFAPDQNQKTYYETTDGGYRLATTIGGHATGEHPDFIGVDDPHDVEGAESDVQRHSTTQWWDLTMPTRGVSRGVRKAVVMQRLHEDDLSGHIIAQEPHEWVHICLPMRYEPRRMTMTPLGWTDQRKTDGALLFPELFDEDKTQKIERRLGLYGTAGQLQQRPAPLGGGMFKRHFFEFVDVAPAQARRVRYWDKAATKKGGAYSSGVKMSEAAGIYYIENVKRAQMDPFERNRLIRATCEDDAIRHSHAVVTVVEQEPGAGGKESALISVRELAGYAIQIDRVHTGKVERAYAFASQCGAGNVKIVGKPTDQWVRDLLDEFEEFPNGKYKDQVDCCTGAFNRLALGVGMLENVDLFGSDGDDEPLTDEEMEDMPPFFREIVEEDAARRKRGGMTYDPRELAE